MPRYLPHHERLPLFFVIGDLAPASNEVVYNNYVKPLILKTWDVTYVEYYRRGLEELPEEIPRAFDWMDRHRRDPYPKSFEVITARSSDDRFYGVVIREFGPGRTTAPEAAEMLGQNLNPATIEMKSSSLSNMISLDVNGIKRLDIWLSPKLIDFKRKLDIRINGVSFNRQPKVKLEIEPMLEDLRMRGDRQQIYWYRISAAEAWVWRRRLDCIRSSGGDGSHPLPDVLATISLISTTEPPVTDPQTPDWVRDAVFYQIFPDRFARSLTVPKPRHLDEWGAPPTYHGYQGGDLIGVVEQLDYLVDLGINARLLHADLPVGVQPPLSHA